MYIPSPAQFSSLNSNQKIFIVENLHKAIESQKKNYLKNKNNNNINKSFLSSSSSSINSDDIDYKIKEEIISKAKMNLLNIQKDFEKYKYGDLLELNEKVNNEVNPEKEINYIIESTKNSNDSSINDKNNNYNNSITRIRNCKNNLYHSHTYNKSIQKKKEQLKNEKYYIDKLILYYNNNNNKETNIQTPNNKVNNNKNNNSNEINNSNNINNSKIMNIKQKLDFSNITKSKKSNSLLKAISSTHRKKVRTKDISERLYNMHEIIKEKINKKKEQFDKDEMINCSFAPKINNNSKKIMKKKENFKNNDDNDNYNDFSYLFVKRNQYHSIINRDRNYNRNIYKKCNYNNKLKCEKKKEFTYRNQTNNNHQDKSILNYFKVNNNFNQKIYRLKDNNDINPNIKFNKIQKYNINNKKKLSTPILTNYLSKSKKDFCINKSYNLTNKEFNDEESKETYLNNQIYIKPNINYNSQDIYIKKYVRNKSSFDINRNSPLNEDVRSSNRYIINKLLNDEDEEI